MSPEDLERITLQVYRRYEVEVVEGLNLCPWAKRAREDGRVVPLVMPQRDDDPAPAAAQLRELAPQSHVDIALLIFPLIDLDRQSFDRFVAELRRVDEPQWELGHVPFALAAFHYEARRDSSRAERLVPYIRRSPDPTIQVVRRTVLDDLRRGPAEGTQFIDLSNFSIDDLPRPDQKPLRERIAIQNQNTLEELGYEAFDALIDDIKRERDELHRRYAARLEESG